MRHRKHPAFTQIELVTTIVILAIIGVMLGSPTAAYVNTIRSRSAGARMAADLRYAQRLAMSSRQRTWILFNAATESYQLYVENLGNPGKSNRQALEHPLDQSTSAVQFGTGPFAGVGIATVNINGGSELEFDSFGVPYDTNGVQLPSNGTITLTNGVSLTIYPLSGYVEQAG